MRGTRALLAIGLAVAILIAPPVGEAQTGPEVHKLGFLMGMDPQPAWQAAFKRGLEQFGWFEGWNIFIEYRSADGYFDRLSALCSELVSLRVDLILAVSAPETAAARQCTTTIPIVFAIHGDPVGTGDVESLAHPGGNATGMSQRQGDLVPKLLGLLKETVPGMSHLAVLWNAANKAKQHDWEEVKAAALAAGIALNSYEVRAPDDLNGAFSAITKNRPDALLVFGDPLTVRFRKSIVELAARERLPAIYAQREFTEAGGLMSYSADLNDLFRRAARIVDKILKGEKPANLPVEQPTKFEFVINMRAATALGLTFPPTVLEFADDLIE
jgi:putative ABC transport system substrate-binding protein